jgi:hypothetical protein
VTKQALSSSGVSVGVDAHEIIKRHATRMWERQQRAEQELRIQEQQWKYEERESFVCVARRVDDGKASSLPLWVASTVTEVGKAGVVHTRPEQECFLESQMRLDLARAFVRAGMVRSWDDARARAARATILFADKVG